MCTHTLGPNFLIFMQFWGEIGQNNRLVPQSVWLAPPPLGNPGSTTVMVHNYWQIQGAPGMHASPLPALKIISDSARIRST